MQRWRGLREWVGARGFLRWAVAAYAIATAAMLVFALRRTGGHFAFITDDPAIHLTVARNLAEHGTWGVVPGHFQSASSSPVWTLLLTAWIRVLPGPLALAPLALNAAASVWVLAVIGENQRLLRPSLRRPLDVVAVALIAIVLLFLPALTVLGMEHTLHMALVLSAVVLLHDRATGTPTRWPAWVPFALLGIATLVRFETLFVAVALGVAFLALSSPGWRPATDPLPLPRAVRLAATVLGTSIAAYAVFAVFNRAMGQGWLPNSVLAKSTVTNGSGRFTLVNVVNRFTTDPLLAALAGACGVSALLAWGQRARRFVFPAITVTVATALHVVFADVGWYERYEAYLVVLALYALFVLADEWLPATRRPPARSYVVPGLVLFSLVFCATKVDLTGQVPRAVSDTYEQRYQAGLFLQRYYDDQPVATSELGYISLDHRGPITDVLGLGDYDVLEERRRHRDPPPAAYWDDLARARGFDVVVMYPATLVNKVPTDWILVGDWTLKRRTVTAFDRVLQFWATTPDEVRPLEDHLREFQDALPTDAQLHLNPLAEVYADQLRSGR